MRFLVCQRMAGGGCDYSIGCGMRFDWVEADSIEAVEEKTVWPNGRDERSRLEGEMGLSDILIIPEEHVHVVDVKAIDASIAATRHARELNRKEQQERAELARLRAKYGN